MLAPLSTHEEATLRKIGFGSSEPLEPAHVRRLLQLELIEMGWPQLAADRRRPTARYESLVFDVGQRPAA
ncbi:MAG TPA: hypothetical protein VFF19_27200 [Reyranella sp.]|nr:hypothetical protein [Reyranella sp.]